MLKRGKVGAEILLELILEEIRTIDGIFHPNSANWKKFSWLV